MKGLGVHFTSLSRLSKGVVADKLWAYSWGHSFVPFPVSLE